MHDIIFWISLTYWLGKETSLKKAQMIGNGFRITEPLFCIRDISFFLSFSYCEENIILFSRISLKTSFLEIQPPYFENVFCSHHILGPEPNFYIENKIGMVWLLYTRKSHIIGILKIIFSTLIMWLYLIVLFQ